MSESGNNDQVQQSGIPIEQYPYYNQTESPTAQYPYYYVQSEMPVVENLNYVQAEPQSYERIDDENIVKNDKPKNLLKFRR